MYGLGYISSSVNQTLTPSATLSAPGDMYIITDTRQRPRKDLTETKAFQRFDIEPYDGSEMPLPNENGVVLFPVKDLYFDTANFQNRDAEFSETSVNRILDAVDDGDFNWAIFDPITIWRNPDNGKFYVLSGHSRSEAFRRLSADGASVDGRNFDRIPAKIFAGTFEQAKELALNSNTLSTKETDLERANYYRERREKFAANGLKNSEIKKRLLELARKNEGKNATKIIYLSHLNPRGSVVDAVAATSDGASVDKNRVAVMAEWVGHLRYDFPQLTDFHERELFDFLKNGHYGVDVRNFNDFAKRVQTAIEKHTEWGVFDADKSLNLEKNLGKSENEKRFDAELNRLKSEWADAENILNRKLAEFKARQKRDASITDRQILQAVQPYKDAAILAKAAYFAFRDKRGDFLRADEAQMSLFGLGKPTIKFEVNDKPADIFNCPESQLQTRGYKPTYIRLNDYSHLIDTADGRKTLKGYGFESATLNELVNACRYYPQVAALAAHLKDPNGDPLQTAFNDWHWLHTNIRYDYDTPGEEEIRTPARVWRDRFSGVDCDCLAVMTACLLINQGFHPCFEIVAFNNEPTFSHIYVNLDGAAIDRVLPVFLARPDNITKTQIMDIPVYALSGIGGCRDTLSGVYASTLTKIQNGTATGEDNNDFRKTQVLVTLRGIDNATYQLAALLMPHVVTIADDGTYYFDSTAMANLATKLDGDLATLIAENADADTISQWIANAATQIDGAASVASNGGNDTVVVIINPKGDLTRVIGQMAKGDTPNLTDTTADAINTRAAASSIPAIMQTSPMPGVAPDGKTESDSSDWWKYAIAAAAAFGAGAMVTKSGKKTKKRK